MDEPYQPPATDPAREETPPSPRERRAGPVARFMGAATILIAIALIYKLRGFSTSAILQPDAYPSASPQFLRILVLDYPHAPTCLAIILAVVGGAISFTRKAFLALAIAFAAAALLAAWAGILSWVLLQSIKGVTG